jgi:hypothetical protein
MIVCHLTKGPYVLSVILLRLKQEALSPTSECFRSVNPCRRSDPSDKPAGNALECDWSKIAVPWLSWQVVKRAHGAMLSELRMQLNNDLVSSAQ